MATEDPTAEKWLPVVGYEGWYEVSNFGRVRGCERTIAAGGFGGHKTLPMKLLCPCAVGKGYKVGEGYDAVGLSRDGKRKMIQIHRLVLTAFLREPLDGEVCNHKNHNRSDNRVENLEWTTPKGNTQHMILAGRGRDQRGELNGLAKLTTSAVVEIRERVAAGETQRSIAKRFAISQASVSLIVIRKTWAHIS